MYMHSFFTNKCVRVLSICYVKSMDFEQQQRLVRPHAFNTDFHMVAASVLYIICLTSAEDVSALYNSSIASQFKCTDFPYKCIAVLCEAIAVICNSIYFQHEYMAFPFKAMAFFM